MSGHPIMSQENKFLVPPPILRFVAMLYVLHMLYIVAHKYYSLTASSSLLIWLIRWNSTKPFPWNSGNSCVRNRYTTVQASMCEELYKIGSNLHCTRSLVRKFMIIVLYPCKIPMELSYSSWQALNVWLHSRHRAIHVTICLKRKCI